jgi:hypothetical protein
MFKCETQEERVGERKRFKQKKRKLYYYQPAPYATFAGYLLGIDTIYKTDEGYLAAACDYCGRVYVPPLRSVKDRVDSIEAYSGQGGERRLYCSEECKIACPIYGQVKHYKGQRVIGSSREVPPLVRQMVLKRDNYTCQRCLETDAPMIAHHKYGYAHYPALGCDICDIVTVCLDCHKAIHKIPGCTYRDFQCEIEYDIDKLIN